LRCGTCGDVVLARASRAVVDCMATLGTKASELGLRLNVDQLVEFENVEDLAHSMCRGNDDEPSTKPLDVLVDAH
jgi:hypothetical protein